MDDIALKDLFARVDGRAVGILGDFCVDAYWELHPELGERSIETGIVTTPVTEVRYSPGGAGNIAANLQALAPKAKVVEGRRFSVNVDADTLRKWAAECTK